MNDRQILKKVTDYSKEGVDGNYVWERRAKTNGKYYKGLADKNGQWNPSAKAKLKAESKPALTFNHILPTINTISGLQRENTRDIKAFPKRGATRAQAQVLTAGIKHIYDISNGHYETSMSFLDGIVFAKGWMFLDIDYNYDPWQGDLILERVSPFEVNEDPNASAYDLNKNGNFIERIYYWDKEAILTNFPKAKKDINISSEEIDSTATATGDETDSYQEAETVKNFYGAERYKINEMWWRSWERRKFLVNPKTLEFKLIHEEKKEIVQAFIKKFPGWAVVDRVTPILHKTLRMGNLILENVDDPFKGVAMFPGFRFAPYWLDGDMFGVVDNLTDPQDEINKRYSNMLHHLNQSSNSGWLGEKGWEVEDEDQVKQFGTSPGVNLHYHKGKKPERIQPTQLSSGHANLMNMGAENIKIISNINADMTGAESDSDSGIAMQLRRQAGTTGTRIIFDNYDYTMQILANALKETIQKTDLLSDQELASLVEDNNIKDIKGLRDFKVGRFGIKMERDPNTPTARLANFQAMLNAVKAGIPIPPQYIIALSDIPNKEEIEAEVKKQQEMQAALAQQQAAAGNKAK